MATENSRSATPISSAKNDLSLYIGRFSPFHNGHAATLRRALQRSKVVLVLVGSAGGPRTIKDPFTAAERSGVIWRWYEEELKRQPNLAHLKISPLADTPYNDQLWIRDVQVEVEKCKNSFVDTLGLNPAVFITGAKRDISSWYLDAFPTWQKDFIQINESDFTLTATQVRNKLFVNGQNPTGAPDDFSSMVPQSTLSFIQEWVKTDTFALLRQEFTFIEQYKMAWDVAPYAPTFVTVDGVVVQSGHVLLVKRRAWPGKGLYALPGGFVNQRERLQDAVIRELREETKLKIPVPVLNGSIKSKEIFDHPDRSLRGRTVTTAFLIVLPDQAELPPVKGGSDAAGAEWVPIAQIQTMRDCLFEDHFSIIQTMLGRITN